jgi:parallel beta-helix repeat protein
MLINNYNYNIVLLCSSGDIISENNITGNPWGDYGGLFLYLCSDSVVCENNITDNEVGLWITDCSSISVCGNAMENNWGSGLNLEGDGDAPGYNIISGNNITGGILGILFRGSNSDNITGNNIITDVLGVWLSGTVSDCVFGNNISAFATGDYLEEPMEKAALFLDSSVFNTIYENNITNSLKGMSLSYSSNNTVFHNRFVNNSLQVMSNFSTNTWDNGYPSGGNYWSDYNGTDYYNGAYQNLTGCDGIGDTPYMIDSNNTDHYPLAHQSGLVGDLNRDNNVGLDDLVLMAEAYGSHAANYDYQGETASHNWNPNADIAAPYGKISLSDLVTLALHYGQHYP